MRMQCIVWASWTEVDSDGGVANVAIISVPTISMAAIASSISPNQGGDSFPYPWKRSTHWYIGTELGDSYPHSPCYS